MSQKILSVSIIMIAVGLFLSAEVFATEAAEPCGSCDECETKLASGIYPVVQLDVDIVDHAGTCINLNAGESTVVFDCAGHLMDGDELGVEPARGVAVLHGSNNTIRNCTISDFDSAIYVVEASGMEIRDNDLVSNRIGIDLSNADSNIVSGNTIQWNSTGIKISNSDNNVFEANSVCDNFPWDFYLASGTGNEGFDNTCESTWYWNDLGAIDCTFSCTVFGCGFESGNLDDWSSFNG